MIKVMKQINNFIKTKYPDKEKNETKSPLQIRAQRMLIVFFVVMFLLTVTSRAAASITVAQVSVQNPQASMLTFEADGTGVITANAKKYVRVPETLVVSNLKVTAGQNIKKGEVLFTLNQKSLQDAITSADAEADKLVDQIKQEQLSVSDPALSEQDVKSLSFQHATADYKDAKTDQKDALTDYQKLKSELVKAQTDYKSALTKSTDQLYGNKIQELKEEKNTYDSVSIANDEALKSATRTLDDAKDTLNSLKVKDLLILKYLDQYNSSYRTNSDSCQDALDNLYSLAYSDMDSYENHKDTVKSLQKKVNRAHDDYISALLEYDKQKYLADDLSNYQNAVTTAKRAYEDAQEELASENKKEIKIKKGADNYVAALSNNDSDKKEQALLLINQTIYTISGYEAHKSEISKATTKIAQCEDDMNSVIKKNELALSAQQNKIDTIQKILDSINNGSYDSTDAAQTEKQKVDSLKQELKTQLQTIKTAKRAAITAQSTLQTAKLDYKKSKEQDILSDKALKKQTEAASLRADALKLDLETKKQLVKDLANYKKNNGNVLAPESGTIDSINIEPGKATTSENYLAINMDRYGITVTVPEDQGDYVSIGDTIELTQKGKKDRIKVKAESIRFTKDTQGTDITEITAIMPKGDYILGATLAASITKNSDLYDICIPVSAVRYDSAGAYCLITQTRDTVLGNELLAIRVNVKVIESDSKNTAVEASLDDKDDVIISSNKEINEGDRVRMKQ